MAGSIGKVIIPVVSTCDPTGFNQAKSNMKELEQASGGAGGGGGTPGRSATRQSSSADEADQIFERTRTANEKYAYQVAKLDDLHKRGRISTETYHRAQRQAADMLPQSKGLASRLGLGQAGQMLADQTGLGGVTSALGGMGAAGIVAGAAAAGVAIYGLTQKFAGQAIALREQSRQLGLSSTYYSGLTIAAAKAGVSVETVTQGLGTMKAMAGGALTGDIGAALFLRSMGISKEDLATNDTEALSKKMLAGTHTAGQKAAVFGSVAAADAINGANGQKPAWYQPTAGSTAASAELKSTVGSAVEGLWGKNFMILKSGLTGKSGAQQEAEAEAAERKARAGQIQAEATKAGMTALPGLLSPAELARERQSGSGALFAQFGENSQRYADLHHASVQAQQTAAEAPYMGPRELAARETADWKEKSAAGGFSNAAQATEAGIQIREKQDQGLRGTRSNAENMGADMARNSERYQKSLDADKEAAAKEKAIADQEGEQAEIVNGKWVTKKSLGKSAEIPGAAQRAAERTDLDRGLGDQLTSYVEGMTASGPQQGAYGVNTVQGASAMMGAEYQMDQSQQTAKMVECLMKIAENTGHLTKERRQAVEHELGHRYNDPISGFLNMLGNH